MKTPNVPIADCTLHCRTFGNPANPPILFIHGFPLTGEMWLPVASALQDSHFCVVPDLRGFGQSTLGSADPSIAQYADDLHAMLEGLGVIEPLCVVGLSMGGYVAFEFWNRHADRVASLGLIDTRPGADSPDAAAGRAKTADRVLAEGVAFLADDMTAKVLAPSAPEKLRTAVRAQMAGNSPEAVAFALRAMAVRADFTERLTEIRLPTLILVGRDDKITPVDVHEKMAAAITGSRLVIVEDAGHLPPMEKPAEVIAPLRNLLSTVRV